MMANGYIVSSSIGVTLGMSFEYFAQYFISSTRGGGHMNQWADETKRLD